MEEIQARIEGILPKVRKPAQYINQEWNSVHKSHQNVAARIALAYPDLYEIGLPNLGLQILYHIVNSKKHLVAERAYAPWVDMEEELRARKIPLFSWESKTPLSGFDIIGFSLQYEMTFTNVLTMLDLANIPLYAEVRNKNHPLIIGGGPVTYNPEPIAPFFDLFVIGEGEEVLLELIETYIDWKSSPGNRKELLEELVKIPGIYVPSFYHVEYEKTGKIRTIKPLSDKYPEKIERRIISDLDQAGLSLKPLVPFSEVVHDRLSVEIMRGCTRGCRFCQAGMIYRPVRERSSDLLCSLIKSQLDNTGYQEVSLSSLSSTDYTQVERLLNNLTEICSKRGIAISFPSLRMDSFSVHLANEIAKIKKTGLTFAPEAGTQRLRDVMNKDISDEDIKTTVEAAISSGWRKLKLYFMIGLPTETEEDLQGIVNLAHYLVDLGLSIIPRGERRRFNMTSSVSCFTPKPCVPFQWIAQNELGQLEKKQDFLKKNLRMKHTKLKWHDARISLLEGALARGDRRLAKVIELAWKKGCKFDAWTESFQFEKWEQAFRDGGLSIEFFANRERSHDEVFPWSHIDCGVSRDFLWAEYQKALKGEKTPDCRHDQCTECGAC